VYYTHTFTGKYVLVSTLEVLDLSVLARDHLFSGSESDLLLLQICEHF
jgi:hypothetical protein